MIKTPKSADLEMVLLSTAAHREVGLVWPQIERLFGGAHSLERTLLGSDIPANREIYRELERIYPES